MKVKYLANLQLFYTHKLQMSSATETTTKQRINKIQYYVKNYLLLIRWKWINVYKYVICMFSWEMLFDFSFPFAMSKIFIFHCVYKNQFVGGAKTYNQCQGRQLWPFVVFFFTSRFFNEVHVDIFAPVQSRQWTEKQHPYTLNNKKTAGLVVIITQIIAHKSDYMNNTFSANWPTKQEKKNTHNTRIFFTCAFEEWCCEIARPLHNVCIVHHWLHVTQTQALNIYIYTNSRK